MKIKKFILVILIVLIAVISCKDKPKEYEYKIACINKTMPIHWGYGYYKQLVYYEFEYSDTIQHGEFMSNKLTQIFSMKYNKGDSVLIKYPKCNIKESTIIKLTYIKSRNYHKN